MLFATEFATFLRQARRVCPELLLPEGTQLTALLASPDQFAELVPLFPSPLGYAERPWGVLARTQDTAILAMRYEGTPPPEENESRLPPWNRRDPHARDTLIHAQAAYLNDPALVVHRRVVQAGIPPGLPFVVAVGESRPFLASRQPFLKSAVLAVMSGMGSAVGHEYSFHDQQMRWDQYFPDFSAGTQQLWQLRIPIKTLPPLDNLFAIDIDSPAWSSPLHRLAREAFVHWALLARGPERARAFLDLLARWGSEPVPAEEFAAVFGGGTDAVQRELMIYIDSRRSDRVTVLPSRNFWNRLPAEYPAAAKDCVSRPATLTESARIRADLARMLGENGAAERALAPRFKKGELNDHIWITTGLMMLEQRNATEAVRSFAAAVELGTRRPLPYVELARLQLRLAQARRTGRKELDAGEARAIFALLREAQARPPALRATTALLADVIDWHAGPPASEWNEMLESSAQAWGYDTALVGRAAATLAARGDRARAARLLALARRGTLDRHSLAQLDRIERGFGAVDAAPAADAPAEPAEPAAAGREETTLVPENGERDFTVPDLGLELVRLAPGSFRMGGAPGDVSFRSDQQPRTEVTLRRGFWIGRHEVTQRQWTSLMRSTQRELTARECPDLPRHGEGDALPVHHVAWTEAVEFCRRLTERERESGRLPAGCEYRLPTEAEWEYACRAGTTEPFFAPPADVGWLPTALPPRWVIPFNNVTFVPQLRPVGGKKPNSWGLHDLYGNVSEWCGDWYASALPGGAVFDPTGPTEGVYRVVRGGSSWGVEAGVPIIGSAVRSRDLPGARFGRGFRVVLAKAAR